MKMKMRCMMMILSEEIFLAVDAVLLSAQAYHMIKKNKYVANAGCCFIWRN